MVFKTSCEQTCTQMYLTCANLERKHACQNEISSGLHKPGNVSWIFLSALMNEKNDYNEFVVLSSTKNYWIIIYHQMSMELVSGLHNRDNIKLEMLVIQYPDKNFILTLL